MPQFIDFVIAAARVGTLRTGNLGDSNTTCYQVSWCTGSGWQVVDDFDTGIECQPCQHCMPKDAESDAKCDFTHARRAIAAMAAAASKICETIQDQSTNFVGVQLHLRTNAYYRGVVSIQPSDGGELILAVKIGGVTGRFPEAYPPTSFKESKSVVNPGAGPLQAAFRVIESERTWLLDTLESQVSQPSPQRACVHRKAGQLGGG
jgi:hypothetical protein